MTSCEVGGFLARILHGPVPQQTNAIKILRLSFQPSLPPAHSDKLEWELLFKVTESFP